MLELAVNTFNFILKGTVEFLRPKTIDVAFERRIFKISKKRAHLESTRLVNKGNCL